MIQTPDGNAVFMWSYAVDGDANYGSFQYPGPVLCANEGETVQVVLRDALPDATSIVFPGQDAQVDATGGSDGLLTRDVASGDTITYSFLASQPGTYLYESGTDVAKQIEMGLYGALIIRPAGGADSAYGTPSTQFDPSREYLLLLGEIDPDLHHAVQFGGNYDFTRLHNRYYTVNGRSFPDTIQDNDSTLLPNQPYGALVRIQPNSPSNTRPALIRMINAGVDNHPFHPHGNHLTEIAQDGRLLLSPSGASAATEHFGETIGSGQTQDFLLRWDPQATDTSGASFNDNWNPTTNPFPIAAPDYLNVTFKDARTWYSGTPYLGYRGTMPTGTVSENVCGEWYFPWHSHALNEFSNFNEGFGGLATLLRVDPSGGCFASPTSTAPVGGVLSSGSVINLGAADGSYYVVNPKTTTRTNATNTTQTTITVASAAGFPATGAYFIRIDNEVMQVTSGQGTTTWTVARAQLGTSRANHSSGATVTALATDWYAGFSGVPAGSQNLRLSYLGKNCANTTPGTCTALTTNLPLQTTKICDWTIGGAAGCATSTTSGWVALVPASSAPVGSPTTTRTSATTPAQTTITVASAAGFPTSGSYYVRIDNEVMQVTAGQGTTTWTVVRGQLGTAAAAHTTGAAVGQEVYGTWTTPSSADHYIGTGSYKGQIRVLVHTQRWTATSPTPFSTWGNLMKLVYDAP
jgi:hypothetical protein